MSHVVVNLNNSHETDLTYNSNLPFTVDFYPDPLDSPNCATIVITQEGLNTSTRRKETVSISLSTDVYITNETLQITCPSSSCKIACSFTKENVNNETHFRLSYYPLGFNSNQFPPPLSNAVLFDKANITYALYIFDKDDAVAPNGATGVRFSRPIYGKLINLGTINPPVKCNRT